MRIREKKKLVKKSPIPPTKSRTFSLTHSQQHDNGSFALKTRIVQRLRPPYRVVYFLSVDWHVLGGFESKSDIVTSNFDHRNDDVVVDDDALVLFFEAYTRQRDENADIAMQVFELSQSVHERWLTAENDAKHCLLEILCLNFKLDGVSLVPEWRKPFDVLAKGLVPENSRGD